MRAPSTERGCRPLPPLIHKSIQRVECWHRTASGADFLLSQPPSVPWLASLLADFRVLRLYFLGGTADNGGMETNATPVLPTLHVRRWRISPIGSVSERTVARTIAANSAKSAWDKFVFQYFGALKPYRCDWKVQEVRS